MNAIMTVNVKAEEKASTVLMVTVFTADLIPTVTTDMNANLEAANGRNRKSYSVQVILSHEKKKHRINIQNQ